MFFYDSAWFAAHCRDIKALLGEDSCVMRCRLSCEVFVIMFVVVFFDIAALLDEETAAADVVTL